MQIRERISTSADGTNHVVEKQHYVPTYASSSATAVVWRIASIIMVLLSVRFIFKLLGANVTGVVQFIYQLTEPFVAPFRGIFSSPSSDVGFFETASILAIIMIAVLAWIIASLLNIDRHTDEV